MPVVCRHVHRKISAHLDGGLSGGSSVRRPRSEDPYWHERKFFYYPVVLLYQCFRLVSSFKFGIIYQECGKYNSHSQNFNKVTGPKINNACCIANM